MSRHHSIRRVAVSLTAGVALVLAIPSARAQDLAWRVFGSKPGDHMGYRVVRVCDVNGDGVVDVATGIPKADQSAQNCGAVRMLSGKDGSTIWTTFGEYGPDDVFGAGLGVRDDGAGVRDVVVGAPQPNGNGYALVLSGTFGGYSGPVRGDSQFDELGAAVDGIGDVTGDGIPDFAVGAPGDDNTATDSGSVKICSGWNADPVLTIDGPAKAGASFGTSLAGLGDVDGDGQPDLAVGEIGAVDVFQGNTGNLIYQLLGDPNHPDLFGTAVANLGDLDADGINDFIVGAPGGVPGGGGLGIAYVYSGASGTLLMSESALVGKDRFGTAVGGCGDVDGDGQLDFVVGAVPQQQALSYAAIFSGRTARLLYQLWADDFGTDFGIAVSGAGDVDGDGLEDVLVGADADFDRQGDEGSVSAFLGNDLWLQSVPPVAYTGTAVSLQIRNGPPAGLAGLYLVELNGVPLFAPIAFLHLDGFGESSLNGTVPPGLVDVDCRFRAYAIGPGGGMQQPTQSHDEELSLR